MGSELAAALFELANGVDIQEQWVRLLGLHPPQLLELGGSLDPGARPPVARVRDALFAVFDLLHHPAGPAAPAAFARTLAAVDAAQADLSRFQAREPVRPGRVAGGGGRRARAVLVWQPERFWPAGLICRGGIACAL